MKTTDIIRTLDRANGVGGIVRSRCMGEARLRRNLECYHCTEVLLRGRRVTIWSETRFTTVCDGCSRTLDLGTGEVDLIEIKSR